MAQRTGRPAKAPYLLSIQSMVAPLRKVLLKRPDEGPGQLDNWQEFGFHRRPDPEAARREHDAFARLLSELGAQVVYAEERHPRRLDSIFITDPVLMTDTGALIARMGKEVRRGEEEALERELTRLDVPILGRINGEGTLEGGDCLWLDRDTLVIGRSYRTNDAAFKQTQQILSPRVRHIIQVHLPHWRGRGEILHLLSLISPIAPDLALVYPPLLPIPLAELLEERGIATVPVPDEEFDTQGCNALAVAPRRVVMARGNPITVDRLRAENVEVYEYDGDEISINRGGGPTCLTCCIEREYR